MLWTCLRFPRLALEALRADPATPGAARKPCAVVTTQAQRRTVVLANAAAHRAGVHAGQPLATAHLLCPGLHTLPRDEGAERQALESLAACAYRFSADIHLAGADAILLETGASLNLFGGWAAFERRLRHDIGQLGFTCHLAAAPTATAAQVLAGQRDGIAIPTPGVLANALGNVPIAAAGLAARIAASLHGMGLRELRELFALPRPELARRIGNDALLHLDRMRGLAAETLPRWQPPPCFERRIELACGVESTAMLAFPLQRLVRELATFLIARDGGVQRFALALGHERGACTQVEVGLLAPQRDAASLFELARARLDRIALPAPVHAIGLHADDLPPLCPLHRDLFEERRSEKLDWPALVERLRARLGDAALHGLTAAADHRPGRAWRLTPLPDRPATRAGSAAITATTSPQAQHADTAAHAPGARPFWLLRRPITLRGGPSRIIAGPERIESGWWDGHDYRRDYYIVETQLGQRAWAYVEAGTRTGWTLHGWFA